jgi:putative ATP-dependent endonuclease of the OLD family
MQRLRILLRRPFKEALKEKEAELKTITDHVEGQVRKIAEETLKKLRELDPSLASELTPTFSPPKWDSLFKASISGDNDIPINKRGSGVKRLVLLSFFRAKAEQAANSSASGSVIYAIEEPETSQHPNNQRLLLRAFSDLSSDYQVVITTHTPMLARALPDDSLRYIHVSDAGMREVMAGGEDTNLLCAQALGVLPDSNVVAFIGLEGPHDIAFLRGISAALRADGLDVIDLDRLEADGRIIFFLLAAPPWHCGPRV